MFAAAYDQVKDFPTRRGLQERHLDRRCRARATMNHRGWARPRRVTAASDGERARQRVLRWVRCWWREPTASTRRNTRVDPPAPIFPGFRLKFFSRGAEYAE